MTRAKKNEEKRYSQDCLVFWSLWGPTPRPHTLPGTLTSKETGTRMLSPALTVSVSFVLESMRNLGQTRTHKMTCCLSPQWLPVQVTQHVDRRLSQCKGQMERAWQGARGETPGAHRDSLLRGSEVQTRLPPGLVCRLSGARISGTTTLLSETPLAWVRE